MDTDNFKFANFSRCFFAMMDKIPTFKLEFVFFDINLTIMITFFFVGSLFGAAFMGVFGVLKFFSYKEEVSLLKETIQRLEILNSDLIYNTFPDARE